MNIILSIIFFLAFSTTTYFISRLLTWFLFKLKPENCKKDFTIKDIRNTNIVMIISIFLWTIIYYNSNRSYDTYLQIRMQRNLQN